MTQIAQIFFKTTLRLIRLRNRFEQETGEGVKPCNPALACTIQGMTPTRKTSLHPLRSSAQSVVHFWFSIRGHPCHLWSNPGSRIKSGIMSQFDSAGSWGSGRDQFVLEESYFSLVIIGNGLPLIRHAYISQIAFVPFLAPLFRGVSFGRRAGQANPALPGQQRKN